MKNIVNIIKIMVIKKVKEVISVFDISLILATRSPFNYLKLNGAPCSGGYHAGLNSEKS